MSPVQNATHVSGPYKEEMAVPEGFEPSIRLFKRITV
jgi:hypothetical protein